MKILKLKFKNINSLANVNEIDFTESRFTDNGIFAITGKTGAGKSSILDAISLALYGRTPRVQITGQENEVMTRGASDCFAEVFFEVDGRQWVSSWKQERTRTGNLKPVYRQIADSTGKIIADQVRTCDSKIVEILGLTFEQFTKVILLAQGSFAAFLQADKHEKGELLEQITGTEIYAEISKKVFERTKTEKEKLDKILIEIGAVKMLSEEEISRLNSETAQLEIQKKQLDTDLQEVETAKKWLKELADLQTQLNETRKKLPGLEQQVKEAAIAFEQAETAENTAGKEQENMIPVLIKVRELDIKISEKENLLKSVIDSLKKKEEEIKKSEKEGTIQELSAQNIEKELKNDLKLLEKQIEDLNHNKLALSSLLEGKLLSACHAEKEKITAFGKEIKSLIDRLGNRISYELEVTNNEQIIKDNLPKINQLSKKITADKKIAGNLEKQIELLRENIVLLEKIKSLEEHRQALEDNRACPLCGATEHPFAKGNVPQAGNKERELHEFIQQLKALNKLISDNENAVVKMDGENGNAQKNRQSAQYKLEENKITTARILEEIEKLGQKILPISDGNISGIQSSIENLENIRKRELENYNQIEQKIKTAEGIEKEIGKLRDVEIPKVNAEIERKKSLLIELKTKITTLQTLVSEKGKQLNTQKSDKEHIETERQKLVAERQNLFGNKQVESEEHRLKNLLDEAGKTKTEAEKLKTKTEIEFAKNQAVSAEKEKELTEKQAKKITGKTGETLQVEWEEKKKQVDEISQKMGANRQQLNTNEENLKNTGKKLKEKELQQQVYRKWASLNELIGSQDGKKYRNFAQALTFEHLIGLTNLQLQKMSERYLLKRTGDASNPFELSVIDKFQNGEERTAQNLSGGEKFIVSLSLALGLANMASKNMKIDTMFIDEGFGTLDSDYLDAALSALSNLQNEGKLIGVISHLTELKERILTHIEVLPDSSGYSKIKERK